MSSKWITCDDNISPFDNMLKQIIFTVLILFFSSVEAKEQALAYKYKKVENMNVPVDVAFFDAEGKRHFLEEYEGKATLVVFWATWCAPCVAEMADLDALQKDFRKLNFVVLPISEDYTGIETVVQFYKSHDLRHLALMHDYKNALFRAMEITGLPTSILINVEGKAIGVFAGSVPWHDDDVRAILLSAISGNPVLPKNSHKDKSLNHIIKPEKEEKELGRHGEEPSDLAIQVPAAVPAPSIIPDLTPDPEHKP